MYYRPKCHVLVWYHVTRIVTVMRGHKYSFQYVTTPGLSDDKHTVRDVDGSGAVTRVITGVQAARLVMKTFQSSIDFLSLLDSRREYDIYERKYDTRGR